METDWNKLEQKGIAAFVKFVHFPSPSVSHPLPQYKWHKTDSNGLGDRGCQILTKSNWPELR